MTDEIKKKSEVLSRNSKEINSVVLWQTEHRFSSAQKLFPTNVKFIGNLSSIKAPNSS